MSTRTVDIGPIDRISIGRCLHVADDGFVEVRANPLDMNMIGDRYARGLSSHGGNMYGRVTAIDRRVTKNAIRPEGSTPVRGSGLVKFGPQVGFGVEEPLSEADQRKLEKRRDAIRKDQASNYDYMMAAMKETAKDDPSLIAQMNAEEHQLRTGGGYDNTMPVDYYTTVWNFIRRANNQPPLDADARQAVIEACESFREHLISCGMRLHSLEPTPFVQVRVDQQTFSKDGTMGWPLLKKSLQPFGREEARAIMSQYDIDLSEMVGQTIDDGYGYQGVARCADAVAALISKTNYNVESMMPTIVTFQRIQRHGWSDIGGDSAQPKSGKARAVYVPDVVWGGGVGAMIMDSWQREIERLQLPDFPSLMTPDDQKRTVGRMVDDAYKAGYVVLSADESGYDQSLRADCMATIMEHCVKPFFKEAYRDAVDVATLSFVYKVIVADEGQMSRVSKQDVGVALDGAVTRDKHILVPVTNGGLISGHKGTMSMGSMYGRVVLQKAAAILLGFTVPEDMLDGVMAGDDNCMLVPRDHIDMSSEVTAYETIEKIYSKFGVEVNPNKQLWVVADDYPVVQFLQKIYHPTLGINGFGSPGRCIQQVDFSEYPPTKLNTAEQALAQISVMENGYDSPFIKAALHLWLASDQRLTYLFQTYGVAAWEYLINQARMDDPDIAQSVLNLETKGAFGWQRSSDDTATDIKLHIVPLIAEVAASEPPAREKWVDQDVPAKTQQIDPGDAYDGDEADYDIGETTDEV